MNQMQTEILCKTIKFYRKKLNITQEQLAGKLGYTKQAISNWETGKNKPNEEIIEAMAKIFGIKSEDLKEINIKKPTIPE